MYERTRFSVTDTDGPLADHPHIGKLARSNDTPSPSEEKILQKMMSDTGKRIDAVDAEVLELKALRQAFIQSIARVDEELASLDKERQRLSDSIRERQILLGALRRMPKEILAHIFFHSLDIPFPWAKNPMSDGKWPSFSARHPFLSFELVSRKWKDVLDTFPKLWSYVNILIDRMTSSTRRIGSASSVARLGPFPDAILMALFSVSRRVQTLHLCLPDRYFTNMQQLPLCFPTLQELVLYSSTPSVVAQHLHFGSLSSLRVFHALDISEVYKLSLPWHQITHFTNMYSQVGHRPPAHHVLDILKATSLLSVCHFSLDLYSLSNEVVKETTLSQLHSLALASVYRQGFGFPPVIPFVLNSLKLPALLDLSVKCLSSFASRDQDTTFTSIRHLLERSHSPLTSLHFNNGEILKDDVIHILSSTPTLQDLRLTNVGRGITDEVVNDLARRADTESGSRVPAFVPHLHTLHLSGQLNFQVEVFVGMVESRWTCHPRHLRSVEVCRFVDRRREREEEEANILALSRLDVLVSEGLDVTSVSFFRLIFAQLDVTTMIVHPILQERHDFTNRLLRQSSNMYTIQDPVDDEPVEGILNDVESLKKGVVKTDRNKQKEFTILLVGETGVGKTAVLSLIANVLAGKRPDNYKEFYDPDNEAGGTQKHSQTKSARVYTLKSVNGVTVRILDSPGLADTRGIQRDELHKKNIAEAIQDSIDVVNAVLILANGTVPRLTVGTDYALSTLSAIFPCTLAENIGFLFTNVSSPLSWNFVPSSLPSVLQGNTQFLLDNPVAMQKKYRQHMKTNPRIPDKTKKQFRQAGGGAESVGNSNGLKPQPTTDIMSLYDQSQKIETEIANTLAIMRQAAKTDKELDDVQRQLDGAEVECKHGREFHRHYNSIWAIKEISESKVNQEAKAKFENAQNAKERAEELKKQIKDKKAMLQDRIKKATEELGRLVERYSNLSLSGSFAGQVETVVKMLEQNLEGMRESGAARETIDKVQASLDSMREKLEVLKEANRSKQGKMVVLANKFVGYFTGP
ncbi:hypothetical protein EV421DRAFT_2023763 [Armillaria borealis]|uniref:AIG1-type G domain-containing protein n=1 Tax=Armillaria borealis TaxID=47425 RepID=A0AA39IYI4_9AGAR|nr:hypothetical protein EV421DRAFT_2023763 [Armillaria borealis]